MPDLQQIRFEQKGRVATLTLNRPEKLNAWTPVMEEEVITTLRAAEADDSIGCIVITGEGRGFCAGADISGWAEEHAGSEDDERPVSLATTIAQRASRNLPLALAASKPTIAAINGPAVGIGLTFALGCDIRIASERARFSARFVRVGLTPESGSSYNLPQVAGIETALELVLTGKIIDASDPLAKRLVSRIVPHEELLPAAYALAEEIAANPTYPVMLAKRLVRMNAAEQDLHRVVEMEAVYIAQLSNKAAHREAVQAFMEKREPRFHD
ncbi:MAG: crotonase/enoyl-CoA hydratase family protein [Dehalococcoidia bacterium]